MFSNCTSLTTPPDVSNWDTSSVSNMSYMFHRLGYSSTTFTGTLSISNFDIKLVSYATNFTYQAKGLTTAEYDATLLNYYAQSVTGGGTGVKPNVTWYLNAKYTSGGAVEAARTSLITNDGWVITDLGAV